MGPAEQKHMSSRLSNRDELTTPGQVLPCIGQPRAPQGLHISGSLLQQRKDRNADADGVITPT